MMFKNSDTPNKSKPISASEDRCMSPVASLNSLAMTLASVYAGWNNEEELQGRADDHGDRHGFPSARPRPENRCADDTGSGARQNSRTRRLQRVAPRASAASRKVSGTARKTSRLTEQMVGKIMIDKMTLPASKSVPSAVPGKTAQVGGQAPARCVRAEGAKTNTPHRP